MQWNGSKNDNLLNFHANVLLPKYVPLFKLVCCQLRPSSHTSYVIVERAQLLMVIVQMKNINFGNLIYDHIEEVF